MFQKDLQISKGTGSQAVGLTNPHAPVWQDGKFFWAAPETCEEYEERAWAATLWGNTILQETILPKEVGDKINAREKESLDLQWAILQAPLLKLRFGFKILSL